MSDAKSASTEGPPRAAPPPPPPRRPRAAGDETRKERKDCHTRRARGGDADFGGERDGVAMGVVEMGRAAPVDEAPAGALLGREARGHETVRECTRSRAENRPCTHHFPRRIEADVALGGRRGEVTQTQLLELHEGTLSGAGCRRENPRREDREEREPPLRKVERDIEKCARSEGESRTDRLGRDEAEESGEKAECGENPDSGRAGRRARRKEKERGQDQRHPDVSRVSDEARRQEPGLGNVERHPEKARPPLECGESARKRSSRHQRREGDGRHRGSGGRRSEEQERQWRKDSRRRERIHDVRVRDGRQERENESCAQAEEDDACGSAAAGSGKELPARETEESKRSAEGLDEDLRLAKRVAGCRRKDQERERKRGEDADPDEARHVPRG
jgi:hypothetical protein